MRLIQIVFVLVIASNCQGQTKEETEKWIIEKLTKYSKPFSTPGPIIDLQYSSYSQLSFKFDEFNLVYSFVESKHSYTTSTDYTCSEKLPVYDFSNVSYHISSNELYLSTRTSSILKVCSGNLEQSVSSIITFYFNGNAETDLEKRLGKAFDHLKTFYKKPKSNETF